MDFDSDIPLDFTGSTEIRLEFRKDFFKDITTLIHAYIYTNIQKDGEELNTFIVKYDRTYFPYSFHGKTYAFRTDLIESQSKNTFSLFIEALSDKLLPDLEASYDKHRIDDSHESISKSMAKWFSV
jgi:hypothetical protein